MLMMELCTVLGLLRYKEKLQRASWDYRMSVGPWNAGVCIKTLLLESHESSFCFHEPEGVFHKCCFCIV